MKKATLVFLFLMFLGFNQCLLLADDDIDYTPKSSYEIFHHYIDMINEHTDSDVFLKDWNNLEYFKFLSKLNDIFLKRNSIFKRNRQVLISSEFTEIFGGIHLRKNLAKQVLEERLIYNSAYSEKNIVYSNVYYIPESLLDPLENIQRYRRTLLKNRRRHDGILVRIENDKIIIYKVLEAKLSDDRYNPNQSRSVFTRWLKEGIYIADRLFLPESIMVKTSDQILSIQKYFSKVSVTNDFADTVMVYDSNDILDGTLNVNVLASISEDFRNMLDLEYAGDLLQSTNIEFIDRILILLRKYIGIYNKIPSLLERKNLRFYLDQYEDVEEEYKLYFSNYDNVVDLVLTLYSIYKDDVLFSIFKERIFKFFTSKEIVTIEYKINNFDVFTYSNLIEDSKRVSIETLVELLGEEHESKIIESVNKYHISTSNPRIDLEEKYRILYQYFFIKYSDSDRFKGSQLSDLVNQTVKDIILTNLDGFIMSTSQRMDIYVSRLSKLKLSARESYIIMKKYYNFSKLDCTNIKTDKIEYIRLHLGVHKTDFQILSYIFQYGLDERDVEHINGNKIFLKTHPNTQVQLEEEETVTDCRNFFNKEIELED